MPFIKQKTANGEERLDVDSLLFQDRIITLSGEVNEYSCSEIIKELLALDSQNSKPIYFYIDSPGGEVYSGAGVIDTIKSISSPVIGVVLGKAMSMGSAFLEACDKRIATKNATIMLHEVSGGCQGKLREMQNSVKEAERLNDILSNLIAGRMNMSIEEYNQFILRDRFIGAEEALKLGLIDEILQYKEKNLEGI